MAAKKQGMGVGSSRQGRGATARPADQVELAERTKRVVQLRTAGATFAQIAEQVGYAHANAAYKRWQAALSDVPRTVVEEARRLEEGRLDTMLAAVWPAVLRGQLGAIDRAINISRRRSRLLGLDAPLKVVGTLTDQLDEEVARLVEAMEQLGGDEAQAAADLAAANAREGTAKSNGRKR